MVMKADKQRLRKVLLDAISLLCKNGLPVETEFCIEATIGITLNEDDVVLVSFKEIIHPDGVIQSESSRVRNELDRTHPLDKHQISNMIIEDHSGEVDSKTNWLSVETNDQIEAKTDVELIRDESKGKYDHSKQPKMSGLRTQKRQFSDHHLVESQTVRHSLSARQKLRQRLDEECVNDIPSTIKEETQGVLDNPVKKEIGYADWNDADYVGGDNDSWMFHEVYNSTGLTYASSSSSAPTQQQPKNNKKLDGDASQPEEMCETDTTSQSWKTHDITQSDESLGQSSSCRRQWRASRSASSLDQDAIVSRALQSLTRSAPFDQSMVGGQPGDPAAAAVFCQICGARLASAATLIKHIKGTHLAMSMCQCEICGEQFKWTMQLCRHRKRYHANEIPVPFAGEETNGTFDTDQVILD